MIKSNKCIICDINAIGYLSLSNGDQSVLFKKDLNGGFYSKIFFSIYFYYCLIIFIIFISRFDPNFRKYIRLVNYWSFNTNVNDAIGIAHLYDGVNK